MTQTIYDDPPVVAKPTADEIRIAELQAIVAGDSQIRSDAGKARESATLSETALRDKNRVLQQAMDRELTQFRDRFHRLHSQAVRLESQVREIDAAKIELLELSPIGSKIDQLEDRLHQITTRRSLGLGTLNENDPIRPVMLERIELLERTDQVHLASAERRKLKRLDDDVFEIQAEIAALKAKIGIAS